MKKYIIYFSLLITLAIGTTSCSDFLSAYSQDMIVAKSVQDLDEILLGDVYLPSFQASSGPASIYTAGFFNILSDDVNTGGHGDETSKAWSTSLSTIFGYFAWQQRVSSNFDGSYFTSDNVTWDNLYSRINIVNIILDEIQDLPHEKENDYLDFLRVQGEAHFLRAYFYFTLANLYGDAYAPSTCESKLCVPLKLTPYVEHDKDKDTQFRRATVYEVYNQIVKDLTIAEDFLTRSPQNNLHRLHRASIESVELLLSRVYLYMQEWELAEAKADLVIQSSNAYLSDISALTSGKPFLTRENPEVLFSQGANILASNEFFTARPGDYCVTRELFDLYDEKDARANCFFGHQVGSDSITLAQKYERGDITSHISDVFTLRVAEAYLNKAEACAMQQGKENIALTTLNKLRKNRIEGYTEQSYNKEELIVQIRDERRKELCFEGHRWFDLRRYAANELHPFSKAIIHVYNACGNNGVSYTQLFRLEENDLAYTFALPESVIDFDNVPMEDNPREIRLPLKVSTDKEQKEEGK